LKFVDFNWNPSEMGLHNAVSGIDGGYPQDCSNLFSFSWTSSVWWYIL